MAPDDVELDVQSLVAIPPIPTPTPEPYEQASYNPARLYANLPVETSRSIRVLDISPAPGSDINAPLVGTLRAIDLEKSPCFTALSYVWGPPGPSSILCNDDYTIGITPNCRDALLALRNYHSNLTHRRGRQGVLTIWIDAICINQQDDGEKAVQLPLMGTIYTFAEAVYVWLGNGTAGAHQTVAWLDGMSRGLPERAGNPWLRGPRSCITVKGDRWRAAWQCYRLHISSRIRRRLLRQGRGPYYIDVPTPEPEHVRDLLQNDWLSRVWTFQEIILASNPILVCGPKAIEWSRFQTGLLVPVEHRFARSSWAQEEIDLQKTPGIAGSSILSPWRELFDLWETTYRPLRWNGTRLRDVRERQGSGEMWRVKDYETDVLPKMLVLGLTRLGTPAFCLIVPLLFLFVGVLWHSLDGANSEDPGLFFIILGSLFIFFGMVFMYMVFWRMRREKRKHPPPASGESTSLVSVLRALRERQAGEPKDRAYALYGVLLNMGVKELARPDYSKDVRQVYHAFFTDLIKWNPSLIALLADVGPAISGIPSWVPDWSTIRERAWVPPQHIYSAAASVLPLSSGHVSLSDDEQEITLRGLVVGEVKDTFGPFEITNTYSPEDLRGKVLDESSDLWKCLYEISCWIAEARKVPISRTYNPDFLPSAVLRALSGHGGREKVNTMVPFDQWYRIMLECEPAPRESFSQRLSTPLFENQAALRYAISCVNNLAGKRNLFLCVDGHIGTGTRDMKVGDRIVFLDDVPVPMVLRRSGRGEGPFIAVGPAYVPGYVGVAERKANAKVGDPLGGFMDAEDIILI